MLSGRSNGAPHQENRTGSSTLGGIEEKKGTPAAGNVVPGVPGSEAPTIEEPRSPREP
ncbi:MAG TPA: hypothetical protein VJ649_01670 [Actinomycetes bacterium]|nr:hypothetical protein [Actinomycetes bacterium]